LTCEPDDQEREKEGKVILILDVTMLPCQWYKKVSGADVLFFFMFRYYFT
jgi:hypothetical protein